MARIVLACWGSHGDIDPFVGLGRGLQSRGHTVVFATLEYYRPLALAAGFEFCAIRPRIDPTETAVVEQIMDRRRGSEFLLTRIIIPNTEAMFEDLERAVEGADLLVSHPITFAAPIVAERHRMPWASAVLAPEPPTRTTPRNDFNANARHVGSGSCVAGIRAGARMSARRLINLINLCGAGRSAAESNLEVKERLRNSTQAARLVRVSP